MARLGMRPLRTTMLCAGRKGSSMTRKRPMPKKAARTRKTKTAAQMRRSFQRMFLREAGGDEWRAGTGNFPSMEGPIVKGRRTRYTDWHSFPSESFVPGGYMRAVVTGG